MAQFIPDDILMVICTILLQQLQFDSLFNCACSAKRFAAIALKNLYRMHDIANEAILAGSKLGIINPRSREKRAHVKRTLLWQSTLRSSIGDKTFYPYSMFIRTLNLRDLEDLFMNYEQKARTKDFFEDDLVGFKVQDRLTWNGENGELDTARSISRISEAITKQTPLLEVLSANVSSNTFSRWIPRFPLLTHFKCYSGTAVERNGGLVRLHCRLFKGLKIRNSLSGLDGGFNPSLAAFLTDLRPQSLESFETFSYNILEPETFRALSCHSESLTELKLDMFRSDVMREISLLKDCTNLVSLFLGGNGVINEDMQRFELKAFMETVAWLNECKKLLIVAFEDFYSAPALITQVFLDNAIRLTSLKLEGHLMPETRLFRRLLAYQTDLTTLWLKSSMSDYPESQANSLVRSMSQLVKLRDLQLGKVSEFLSDRHIQQLVANLPKLECFSFSGTGLTDTIWAALSSLRSLRRLEFGTMESFTADAILGYITKLGRGNHGLVLFLRDVLENYDELSGAQHAIQDLIAEKVEGRFEFLFPDDFDLDAFEEETE